MIREPEGEGVYYVVSCEGCKHDGKNYHKCKFCMDAVSFGEGMIHYKEKKGGE